MIQSLISSLLLALISIGVSTAAFASNNGDQSENSKSLYIFIPKHTTKELQDVRKWAAGGAFRLYAKHAGFDFDFKSYMADCPNLAIFNFGRATGMTYLHYDVLADFISTLSSLDHSFARSRDTFPEIYLSMIERTQFKKYISPIKQK